MLSSKLVEFGSNEPRLFDPLTINKQEWGEYNQNLLLGVACDVRRGKVAVAACKPEIVGQLRLPIDLSD